jgi:hypothetical protein
MDRMVIGDGEERSGDAEIVVRYVALIVGR